MIQIAYISLLTSWLVACLKREQTTEEIVNFLDKVAKEKLEPFINRSYQALAEVTNAYEQKMVMGREAIADKGVWTAKKTVHPKPV